MSTDDEFDRQLREIERFIGKPLSLLDLPPEEEDEPLAENQPPMSITVAVDSIPAMKEVRSEKHTHEESVSEEPEVSDGTAYNQLQTGDLVDEGTQLCPWKTIQTYPDRFIGKANRPRVSSSKHTSNCCHFE
jgi:hypothetical protein